ncbi:MAG: glycine--tRNA ligase [Sphingobacteriales bacterium]|nr:MAG: glycine--tRNA ligase [Sphingobacteriales bacterium]
MANENKLQAVIAHAKEYGFVFPSSEIYDGLGAVYDYGQWGAELKKNLKDYWWRWMTQTNEQNIVGIDSAIFMHPQVWKASGHVDNFSDPMIDNKDSKKRYRVDHLIEGYIEDLKNKAIDAILGKDAVGVIVTTDYPDIINHEFYQKGLSIEKDLDRLIAADDFVGLKQLIEENKIACSVSKTVNWTEVRQFNLMFSTEVGSVAEESSKIYLRPETAQGIFVNFLNVQKTARMKLPFGIAQIGKAFRNEIVARGFIFRMREFEQMEMQFFVRPGTQKDWYAYWKAERMKWHLDLGIDPAKYRYHDHVKLAHYADAACDIEFDFPMGFKELEGIHSRTDFDLKSHQELSKKKLQYFDADIDPETGKAYGNYIPYVIETSIGLDRAFLAVLSEAYEEEDLSTEEKQDSRSVLKISPKIAPIKLAVLPLMKKDGLPEVAAELMAECRKHFKCFYEEKDAIGKRYRRMDAIGTPFCVTIDHQSKEDGTVTIRHRDSMLQERVHMGEVVNIVKAAVSY